MQEGVLFIVPTMLEIIIIVNREVLIALTSRVYEYGTKYHTHVKFERMKSQIQSLKIIFHPIFCYVCKAPYYIVFDRGRTVYGSTSARVGRVRLELCPNVIGARFQFISYHGQCALIMFLSNKNDDQNQAQSPSDREKKCTTTQ